MEELISRWVRVCEAIARDKGYVLDCSSPGQLLIPTEGTKLARKYGGFRLLLFQAPEKEKGVFSRIIHKIM
jgi:hypothetical protein